MVSRSEFPAADAVLILAITPDPYPIKPRAGVANGRGGKQGLRCEKIVRTSSVFSLLLNSIELVVHC